MPRTENAESIESQTLWNSPTNSNRSNLNDCDFSRSSFESSTTNFIDDQGNLIDVSHDRQRSKWRIPFTSIVWPRSQAGPPSARTTIQLHPRWIAIMPSKLNRSCYWTIRALRLILVLYVVDSHSGQVCLHS